MAYMTQTHKEWFARFEAHEAASFALCAKHARIGQLALARVTADTSWDLLGFFARLRVRFNQELDRIPTP